MKFNTPESVDHKLRTLDDRVLKLEQKRSTIVSVSFNVTTTAGNSLISATASCIEFGNPTDNPLYAFLGSGGVGIGVTACSSVAARLQVDNSDAAYTTAFKVTGNSVLTGALSVSAATTLSSTLSVTGAATFSAAITQSGGAFSFSGSTGSLTTTSGALTLISAAAINIGTSTATSIAIGRAGITTTVTGIASFAGQVFYTGRDTGNPFATVNNFSLGTAIAILDNQGSNNSTWSGITGGSQGRWLLFRNSSSFTVTLLHESLLSTAANRFFNPDSINFKLASQGAVWLLHNGGRWCPIVPQVGGVPSTNIQSDAGTATIGAAAQYIRTDAQILAATATASSIARISAQGSSTSLARADHTHSVTNFTLTSEAAGTITYFDGSNWIVLAPGSSGNVLKTLGTSVAWAAVTSLVPYGTPSVNVLSDASSFSAGVSTDVLRADARLIATTAAPGTTALSDVSTAAQGSATSLLRSDARIIVSTAVPSVNVLTDASSFSQGTATSLLRSDARFIATTAAPGTTALSDASAATQGSATTFLRSDARLIVSTATPSVQVLTDASTASQGSATSLMRSDARLLLTTGVPSDISTSASQGSSTSSVRLDHVHALTFAVVQTILTAASSAVSFNSQLLSSVATPVSSTDAATKGYVDSVAQGLSAKGSVRFATTAALPANAYLNGVLGVGATLTGTSFGALPTIDGVVPATGDYVLVKNESTAANNGRYFVTNSGAVAAFYVLTRALDMDQAAEFPGAFVFIEEGTVNGSTGWVCTADPDTAFTVGTTAVNFTQFSGAGDITAGVALQKTGNTLDVLTGTPSVTVKSDASTAATGTANSVIRTDAQLLVLTATPSVNVLTDASSFSQGSSTSLMRADARLIATTATAVDTGATSAQGSSASFARANHTHKVTDLGIASQAQGDILFFDGSNWVRLAANTDGKLLTTHGAGANPTWTTVSSGATYTAGTGISISGANVISVDQTFSPSWTGTHSFTAAAVGGTTFTQAVQTTGSPSVLTVTVPSHTTLTAGTEATAVNFNMNPGTGTSAVQFATGAITLQRAARFQAPTYRFVGASTITDAATVQIDDQPTAGTNATITNRWALRIPSGSAGFADGDISNPGIAFASQRGLGFYRIGNHDLAIAMTGDYAMEWTSSVVNCNRSFRTTGGSVTVPSHGWFTDTQSGLWYDTTGGAGGDTAGPQMSCSGTLIQSWFPDGSRFTQRASSTIGTPKLLLVTGAAVTGLTATTEAIDVNFNLARTVKWANGNITTQRAVYVQAPTYKMTSGSPGGTITTATTFEISGAPIAGDATIALTNTNALRVASGNTQLDGTVTSAVALTAKGTGPLVITQSAGSSGLPFGINYTGAAHTGMTAGGVSSDVYFNLARTVTFASGGNPDYLGVRINPPTIAAAGATTMDSAASLYIDNSPSAGSNITLSTATYALWVGAGKTRFGSLVGIGGNPTTDLHLTGSSTKTVFLETSSAADTTIRMSNSTTNWAMGLDDSDGHGWKISESTALGTTDRLTIKPSQGAMIFQSKISGTAPAIRGWHIETVDGTTAGDSALFVSLWSITLASRQNCMLMADIGIAGDTGNNDGGFTTLYVMAYATGATTYSLITNTSTTSAGSSSSSSNFGISSDGTTPCVLKWSVSGQTVTLSGQQQNVSDNTLNIHWVGNVRYHIIDPLDASGVPQ